MVFFSYWTKHESPAGDQFWKFSRQCSIFGHIGDQWVAISSPEASCILLGSALSKSLCDKWIKMVNFKLSKEMWKVNWSIIIGW